MAPLAWPVYMPSYLPRPLAQQSPMQAECEELDRQHHDLDAVELEVQQINRALNFNAVRDAEAKSVPTWWKAAHILRNSQTC